MLICVIKSKTGPIRLKLWMKRYDRQEGDHQLTAKTEMDPKIKPSRLRQLKYLKTSVISCDTQNLNINNLIVTRLCPSAHFSFKLNTNPHSHSS